MRPPTIPVKNEKLPKMESKRLKNIVYVYAAALPFMIRKKDLTLSGKVLSAFSERI